MKQRRGSLFCLKIKYSHVNSGPQRCTRFLINLTDSLFDPVCFLSKEFSVPLSSLALLVPPLRLMSAVMWEVVRQRNIKHYGKLEEFVSMVTDAVPELMSKREGRLLSLGLRARVSEMSGSHDVCKRSYSNETRTRGTC